MLLNSNQNHDIQMRVRCLNGNKLAKLLLYKQKDIFVKDEEQKISPILNKTWLKRNKVAILSAYIDRKPKNKTPDQNLFHV